MKAIEVVPGALQYPVTWWPSFAMWNKFQKVFFQKFIQWWIYWLSYVIEESLSHRPCKEKNMKNHLPL